MSHEYVSERDERNCNAAADHSQIHHDYRDKNVSL